jgi:hypothetical protein
LACVEDHFPSENETAPYNSYDETSEGYYLKDHLRKENEPSYNIAYLYWTIRRTTCAADQVH